ncbi:MAG: YoaK family protein [Culicoidibacterales bacterium]
MMEIDQQVPKKRELIIAFTFSFISGYVDVLGFLVLGGLFLSFMSGNSAKLGWSLATANFGSALEYFTVILAFIFGAFLGDLLISIVKKDALYVVLYTELFLFSLAVLVSHGYTSWGYIIPLTTAMGLQNTAQISINKTIIGKSFVTGMLYHLGVAFSKLVQGKPKWVEPLLIGISWGCFVLGSLIGALMTTNYSFNITIAVLFILILLLILLLHLCDLKRRR